MIGIPAVNNIRQYKKSWLTNNKKFYISFTSSIGDMFSFDHGLYWKETWGENAVDVCGESVGCCRSNCVISFCVPNGIDLTVVVGEEKGTF